MAEVVLRPAVEREGGAIRALLRDCFPDNPKAEEALFTWQYRESPFGATRSWVAVDGDDVVAHYAAMPVPLQLGSPDHPAHGAIGIDAATAASHRGQGLFERLAASVYEDAGARGVAVTLCYPNTNSLRGFQKAGGLDVGRLRTFVRPVDPAWLAARLHLPGAVVRAALRTVSVPGRGAGVAVREVGSTPHDIDALWAAIAPRAGHGIVRDMQWWSWRYDRKPASVYRMFEARRGDRLVGATVATPVDAFGGRFVYLLELLVIDAETARALIGAVARAHPDAAGIATVGRPRTFVARAARAGGLRPVPRRFEPKPLSFGLGPNTDDVPALRTERWSPCWGDLDHL